MTNEIYVVLAYMAIWAGLLTYVVALSRRQHGLTRQIGALAERLGRRED
ncbi:MAG: CcmD family protein [Planctomycetota bacterium]